MILLAVTLLSCSRGVQVRASVSDDLAIVTIVEDRQLAIVLLDGGGQDYLHGIATNGFEAAALAELSSVLDGLSGVEGGVRFDGTDAQAIVDLLYRGATTLRKTRLADTLAKVTGDGDSLSALGRMRSAELFDLRGRIEADDRTSEWLNRYVDEVRRYLRRR